MLSEHTRSDLRVLLNQLEYRVGENIRAGGGEVHQSLETRVGLAQNSVTISRDHTSRLESIPEIVADILICELGSDLILHGSYPAENFLGCQAVEWASQAQETSTVAQERIAQGASNEVSRVG